ncbi:peptidoglycan bridge formation glycyltransferase FemA/FemB family protein [Candidatus Peregrinibacteria bacterium]|nr:peptidoglycan bridge formation glycyltransferase FemA/FemB family protein [Candidatus Peregrinibacteria bacterium]
MEKTFEQFWQKNPRRNLWQHPLWQQFQQAIGRKATFLYDNPDEIHSSALVITHCLPGGFTWCEVPRGPLFEADRLEALEKLLETIEAYGRKEGALFIRYSPYNLLNVPDSRRIAYDHQPQTSLVLDLTLSEDQLLAQMKPKGRYNIRLAEKSGVTVAPSSDVAAFHRLLCGTGARDEFGIHPQAYYEKMLKTFNDVPEGEDIYPRLQERGHAQLLLATHEGCVIAGGLFIYLDDWGIYYYGASDYSRRDLMTPYLVQWTAIREAKKRGCRHYDFLGIAPEDAVNHPWAGVTEFKKKFGGTIVNYEQTQEVPLKKAFYLGYRLYKKFRHKGKICGLKN